MTVQTLDRPRPNESYDQWCQVGMAIFGWQARVEDRFDSLDADVAELKTDVKELKSDVKELKTDVGSLKRGLRDLELSTERRFNRIEVKLEKLDIMEAQLVKLVDYVMRDELKTG